MACNERGMALISVVLLLSVLLTLAHILAEKTWQSTRQAASAADREQLFWAAQAGIEAARRQLAESYQGSDGWQVFLTAAAPHAYPAEPAWESEINGLPVAFYLRDNPDGDDDVGRDNDLKIYVLARARGRRGAEVMVESLCGFDLPPAAGYARPAASPLTGEGAALDDLPVSTSAITD